MARPSKLDADLTKQILAYIRSGNTYEIAAAAVGVSRSTFYSWQSRGKKAIKAQRRATCNLDLEEPFIDFFRDLEKAKAIAIASAVERVRAAMTDDWRAAIAFLERRDPINWGKRKSFSKIPVRPISTKEIDQEEAALMRDQVHRSFPALGEPLSFSPRPYRSFGDSAKRSMELGGG